MRPRISSVSVRLQRSDQLLRTAVLLIVLFLASPAALLSADPDPDTDLCVRVDAYLEPLVRSSLFSGSILLARNGRIVVQAGYGKARYADGVDNTPQTRFKLMSVSKPLTAIAVMTLLQRGELSLADPASKHLPAWPESWKGVTLGHLLSHTSGIPNLELEWVQVRHQATERGLELWPRLAARVGQRPLDSTPGARLAYSNFNYVLLGFVVEAASGQPYADYLRSTVLDGVGMEHTGLDDGSLFPGLAMGYFRGLDGEPTESRQDMSMIQAAGGFYSSVVDLYRLDRALHQDELLSTRTRELMWTPQAGGFAHGWQVTREHGRHCIHHSGGANGFVADFLRFPEEDACVVVLSNFAFAPILRISRDLAAILFGEPYTAPTVLRPEALEAYTGTYRAPGRTLVVRRSGNALVSFDVHEGTQRAGGRLLLPLGEDTFAMPSSARQLRFVADESGEFGRVYLRYGAGVTAMERVHLAREPWQQARGTYRMGSPTNLAVRIEDENGRFMLRGEGGWPALEIVPVSATRAIGLSMGTFGTMLRFDRDADEQVRGFDWHRPDGVTARGSRDPRSRDQ